MTFTHCERRTSTCKEGHREEMRAREKERDNGRKIRRIERERERLENPTLGQYLNLSKPGLVVSRVPVSSIMPYCSNSYATFTN